MKKGRVVSVKGVGVRCVLVSHPRAKRLRITVLSTGIVRITKPIRTTERQAISFAEDNAVWIMNRYRDIEEKIVVPDIGDDHFLKHKEAARELITKKVQHWNQFYGFVYNDIRIKRQRTMWGSCSSKGNLNFNYKLLFLPERLIDYVVVHELCHLEEMNHSERFWKLVTKAMPDYRELSKELRGYL